MNNVEFRKEIHNYIDQTYNEFEQYQKIANEVLLEFNRICVRNNISYCLAYGSLLGAVRDGGQIPWDYDIDVVISIKDREKLIDCLKQDLGEDFYYTYKNNVANYPTTCLRICKKGFSFQALHVDVFFMIGCPSNPQKRSRFIKRALKYAQKRHFKYDHYYSIPAKMSSIKRIAIRVFNLRHKLFPGFLLRIIEESIMHKYDITSSVYCIGYANDSNVFFRTELFKETMFVKDEFPIPIQYEEFLNEFYGNYRNYPLMENRFEEFYFMTKALRERNAFYLDRLRDKIEK